MPYRSTVTRPISATATTASGRPAAFRSPSGPSASPTCNGPRRRRTGTSPRPSRDDPSARRAARRSASNSSTARIWTSPSVRSTSRPVSARPPTSRSRPRWRPGWTSPTCRASAWMSTRPPSTAGSRPLASSPTELPIHRFKSFDGTELAYREMGEGRPVILIHGFFSTATVNWIRYGHAAQIAQRGYRVVMPDLRGHGDSAKSHDVSAYPPDVLADDGFALIEHLGFTDYDLGGYSLGARTSVRMMVRGAKPGRAVVAGMGFDGIVDTEGRGVFF